MHHSGGLGGIYEADALLVGLANLSQSERWPEDVTLLRRLVEGTDAVSGGWISHAERLLHGCQVSLPCMLDQA